jgi:transcriptional regulator of met regulon
VLAIVGLVAKKQLQSLRAPSPAETAAGASMRAPSGTPAQQSQQLQKKVQDDVNKLMQQAPARAEPTQ